MRTPVWLVYVVARVVTVAVLAAALRDQGILAGLGAAYPDPRAQQVAHDMALQSFTDTVRVVLALLVIRLVAGLWLDADDARRECRHAAPV